MPADPTDSAAMKPLAGRRALVTGGARGVGFHCASALASAGAHVVITSRHEAPATEALKELTRSGVVSLVVADIADPDQITDLAEEISSDGPLHILVNNAGVTWGAPLEEYPPHAWNKVLGIDVAAPFQLVQRLLPALREAGSPDDPARVVNIGSIDGHAVGGFDNFAYSAAKAGIHHLTRVLAYRLGPDGITVNCIAPGPIHSKMTAALIEEHEAELLARNPLGRLCQPNDIASALLYLAGPGAGYVTGAVLPVDGGFAISPWWPAPPLDQNGE